MLVRVICDTMRLCSLCAFLAHTLHTDLLVAHRLGHDKRVCTYVHRAGAKDRDLRDRGGAQRAFSPLSRRSPERCCSQLLTSVHLFFAIGSAQVRGCASKTCRRCLQKLENCHWQRRRRLPSYAPRHRRLAQHRAPFESRPSVSVQKRAIPHKYNHSRRLYSFSTADLYGCRNFRSAFVSI